MSQPSSHTLSIRISVAEQRLQLLNGSAQLMSCPISTAANGIGSEKNSGKTPLGKHIVRAKIGTGLPINAVLVGRRPTGEIYDENLAAQYPSRDWILSRILWLSGLERGRNRLGNVDTMQRYIYLHGTPDSEPMGIPRSHGCIRMRNADIIELFDRVPVGTPVEIVA
ncbi:L,D-transpeptidase [Thiomicrorhabdus sp. zzn3]|uniref:L,D-transpeptidase n=1 Tax=Thiomicrorhabdus sp. zzn3 TaxID=3039775 RepID=UPI002436DBDF|nr:L,D-transpeptidase [Thiomicrorhabdus sp. zzn3]MDG6777959.1 L,D-transpeptidase [Thiomicrorhabdus sp. zzn3]